MTTRASASSGVMRRLAAIAALGLMAAAVVLAAVVAIQNFPRGLTVLACILLAVAVAWWGLLRRGIARGLAFGAAVALLAGAIALVVLEGGLLENLLIAGAALLSLTAAGVVFRAHAQLPSARRPERAVLIYNPRSGGGKADRFHIAREARARGIEPVELRPGDDLRTLVRDAIARGADALAVAGGDGTQAIVAALAAEHDLPYACIPAGTRNHFALDLGVDRDDVVGALDALVEGGERRVDLAEVNGRVFVNNVSLGVYAEAVQSAGYRGAKLRTLADTVPQVLGPTGERLKLLWTDSRGRQHASADVMLVSNDPYRLGRALGSGTRPRLDRGVLGIAAAVPGNGRSSRPRLHQWSAPSFEIEGDGAVAVAVDGEAARLDPPLRFRSRPSALRVRIAQSHPGASPSVSLPESPWAMVRSLATVAAGRPPIGAPATMKGAVDE
jgi:diacylglycerol kinase family enzyme